MTTDTTDHPSAPSPRSWQVTFPPRELMSMNDRRHHMAAHKLGKKWLTQTRIFAAEQLADLIVAGGPGPAVVQVELPVIGAIRRDPHNYFATVKPIVDGLVQAGLWPDDTPDFVTTAEPTLKVYARADTYRRRVIVTITERGPR